MAMFLERALLRFPDAEVERAWHSSADDEARGPVRVGLLVFAALIVLAGLGDEWQAYEGWQQVALIRVTVWGPLMLVGAGLVSLPRLRGRVLDITCGVIVLMTLSLIGTMWFVLPRSAAIDYPMYWTVLLLLVHIAPLGLVRANLAGSLVVAGFFATMLHYRADHLHFAAHTVFLLFAWVMLIAASWLLESRARATFLAERRLRTRTGELDALTRLQASVLDTLSEGVCGVGADGSVTFANPAAAFLLGLPVTSVVGARFHDAFHEADDAGAPGACPLCASGAPVQDVPARLRLPDGGVRWVECAAQPNEGGDHPGVRVLSFRDVGRRRELESQVRHSQKMEAIGLFVGGVAHEFNNLLTPILGGVALAGASLGPQHPIQPSLANVGRAGERAAALVRQLLALGRGIEMAPRSVDLSASVTQALAFIRPTLDRRIDIVFVPTPGAWALADAGQLDQILLNLCLNARDALMSNLDHGRPSRIEISVRRLVLDAAAAALQPPARPGEWIELCVGDTGPGIPGDALPRVFEPFFTTKPRGEGSGLGLAVLHGIVQQHGGWVSVDTAVGAGARFRCVFPASSQPPSLPEEPAASPPRSVVARKVLLVDDEQMVREVTRDCLEYVGYAVEDASGGIEAIGRLQAGYRPDIILLDIMMPELDGWCTLGRIRELDPTIPVVMMSGFDADAPGPRPHRPEAHLSKPFKLEELVAILDQVTAAAAPPAAPSPPATRPTAG
ncbi:MAG: response regulator [Pseudomonadota bacterium]|nr:response regulator [Pseudomonadota bacterium]